MFRLLVNENTLSFIEAIVSETRYRNRSFGADIDAARIHQTIASLRHRRLRVSTWSEVIHGMNFATSDFDNFRTMDVDFASKIQIDNNPDYELILNLRQLNIIAALVARCDLNKFCDIETFMDCLHITTSLSEDYHASLFRICFK